MNEFTLYPLDTISDTQDQTDTVAVEGLEPGKILTACVSSECAPPSEDVVIYRRPDGYHVYGGLCFFSINSYRNLVVLLLTASERDVIFFHINELYSGNVDDSDLCSLSPLMSSILGSKAKTVYVAGHPADTILTLLASACDEICLCDTGGFWYGYRPGGFDNREATDAYRPMYNEILHRAVTVHGFLTEEEYQGIIDDNMSVYKIGTDFAEAEADPIDPTLIEDDELENDELINPLDDIETIFEQIAEDPILNEDDPDDTEASA